MKLQFDANQEYQIKAVESVVDLFDGQQTTSSAGLFGVSGLGLFQNEQGVGNLLQIDESAIIKNLRAIQERNGLELQKEFEGHNFTVEMETGTGKTYVYLRSIFELHKRYGFAKFIIVVPGKAIREGVLKSLEITRDHLRSLYGNPAYDFFTYDSKHPGKLRSFATSNNLSVMLINIEAFNTEDRIINKASDSIGGVPIELVKKTNPIVIIDEPQNMESEKARAAINSLNPLCTFRYSATHRNLYNQIYRLTPVDAYDQGLVKRIEVASVREDGSQNDAYIKVSAFSSSKNSITANIEIESLNAKQEIVKKKVGLKVHLTRPTPTVDLFEESGGLPAYEGFVFDGSCMIDAESGEISFLNGVSVAKGSGLGELGDEIMKQQLKDTVQEHLEKMLKFKLQGRDIKVLSLFFIDRVANYRDHEADAAGKYALWFEDIYEEMRSSARYKSLKLPEAKKVHDGYFSKDKQGRIQDSKEGTGNEADRSTYELIMKDKERLLSPEEPLQFIFSHSALKEGWDNPNVFQICTLNESESYVKKRQEIGRGLRLPVDATGQRIFDRAVNVLTVVANESYDTFARSLQEEIEAETGVSFAGRIANKRERRQVKLKKKWDVDKNFLELWNRIKQKTRYAIELDETKFIDTASKAVKAIPSQIPQIRTDIARLTFDAEKGILMAARTMRSGKQFSQSLPVPDMLDYISNHSGLRKETILKVLVKAGMWEKMRSNPQHFMDRTVDELRRAMKLMLVDGVKYEKVSGGEYEMQIFKDAEIESYVSNLRTVNDSDKTLYDHVVFDSEVENEFAEELENRDEVEFYIKLPASFKIETPLGTYNPDWAIVFKNDKRLYLVAETKSTNRLDELKENEMLKISCGEKHFAAVGKVQFVAPVRNLEDVSRRL
jgi:type III restriction enzyme